MDGTTRVGVLGVVARAGSRGPSDRGAAPVEAVILFPLFLILVLTVFQAAVYYHARNAARSAAVGGAVAGAVLEGSADEARAEAQYRIDNAGGSSFLDGVTVSAVRTGTEVTVTVRGEASAFVPGLPPLKVDQTVAAPVERFTAP